MEYAAFLLGVNVGRRVVKMAQLKACMETLGYEDVRTVLASGNVRFSAGKTNAAALEKKLESAYTKEFGFKIEVIVRTIPDLQKMLKADPFKKIPVTKHTRRYVTFLARKPLKTGKTKRVNAQYAILKVTPREVYSHLELADGFKTPDIMKELTDSYGKKITTRNWNTIGKIAA